MAVYVATHKRAQLPRADWLIPLGLNGYRDENVRICDADGADSIARLNPSHGELTGLYWLYKHCDDEYVGLCHYRRYFTFAHYPAPEYNYPAGIPLEATAETFQFLAAPEQKTRMLDLLDTYDFIVPRPLVYSQTVARAFTEAHGTEPWSCFLETADRQGYNPRYFDHETRFYFGNMFVTRLDNFRAFAKSLFSVIDSLWNEIGDQPEVAGARYQPYRYPGYLAERFLGLYIHQKRLRVFETPIVWFE